MHGEHAHGFMVTGVARMDVFPDLRAAVQAAIDDGEGFSAFRDRFHDILPKASRHWLGQMASTRLAKCITGPACATVHWRVGRGQGRKIFWQGVSEGKILAACVMSRAPTGRTTSTVCRGMVQIAANEGNQRRGERSQGSRRRQPVVSTVT